MGFNASPSSAPDRLSDIVRNAERQASNPKFTEQFKEELNQMKLTQAELMELAKCFEESSVDRIKNDAKTVILEQMKQERQSLAQSINPLNWERETQLKVGGAIVGGTILTVIAAKVLKKMGAVGRKIRNGILFAAGTTAAVAGAMLGFKLWQNWGEMKKQMERVNEAADKFMNATKDAKDKTQKELEEARAKLEEIKRERFALKKEKDGGAAAPEAASNAPAEAEAVPAAEEKQQEKDETKLSEKIENVLPYQEEKEITRSIAAQGLLATHRNLAEKAELENEVERGKVADVLGREDVRTLPIGKLAQVRSAQDASNLLKETSTQGTTPAQDKALYFLGMVCNVELQKTAIHDMLKQTGKKPEELTLGEFIDSISMIPSFIGRFAKEVQGKSIKDIDMTKVLSSIFSAEESIKEFENNPTITNRITELHPELKDKKNLASFLVYCLAPGQKGNRSLNDIASAGTTETLSDIERDIYIPALRNIQNTLAQPATNALLVQFAQDNPKHAQLITDYLNKDLTINDAVQLYMFLQLVRNNDEQAAYPKNAAEASPAGALLLQMKILQILGKKDDVSGIELRNSLMLDTVAGVKINLPPQARELITTMGSFAASQTWDTLKDWAKKWSTEAWLGLKAANTNKNAAVYGTTYTVEGVVGTLAGAKAYQWWTRDWVEIMSNRLGGKSLFKNVERQINDWLPHFTETGRIVKDTAEMSTISSEMLTLKKKLLAVPNKQHAQQLFDAYNRFFKRGFDTNSFKEFYRELAELKAQGVDKNIIKEVCKDVRKWEEAENYASAIQRYRFNIFQRGGKKFLSQWGRGSKIRGLGKVGRGAYGSAIALEGAMVYNDYTSLKETQERIADTLKGLEDNLDKAGFKHRYTSEGVVYEHSCGARIKLSSLQKSISSFEDVDLARLGVSSTSLATTILAPSLVIGPAGWVAAGVVITVEAGITAWEQVKQREFIMNTPTPILALLGLGSSIGMNEQDMIEEVSNGMISDLALKDNSDKAEILKKTYAVVFFQQLGALSKTNPELIAEITEGHDLVSLLDENGEFFNKDFEQVIKPYLALRMFQLSTDQGVKWSEFKDLKIDEGWFDERNVRPADLQRALQESAVLYVDHLREKRYNEAQKACDTELAELKTHIDTNAPENDPQRLIAEADLGIAEEEWNERLELLGQGLVRGTPVNRIPRSPDGQTSTAMQLRNITQNLNTKYAGATRGGIPLSEMYVFQTPEAPKHSSERYDVFFKEAQASYYRLKNSNINEWASTYILEFNKIMQRFPEFDGSGAWKNHFAKMPAGNWNNLISDRSISNYYRQTLKVMERILENCVDRHSEFHPESLETERGNQSMYIGDATEIYLTERNWDEREQKRGEGSIVDTAKELHVIMDGKDTAFTANDQARNTWETPYGSLHCDVLKSYAGGEPVYSYKWGFYGNKPGTFQVYHINRLGNREPGVTIEVKPPSKKEILVESLAVVDYDNPPMVFDMTLTMNDGQKVTINYVELRKLENHPLIDKVVLMKNARGDVQRCRVRLNDEGRKQVQSVSFKEPIGEHSETIFRKKNKENEPGLYGTEKSAA